MEEVVQEGAADASLNARCREVDWQHVREELVEARTQGALHCVVCVLGSVSTHTDDGGYVWGSH